MLDQCNIHIQPLIRTACVLGGRKRHALGRYEFFQGMKASSPLSNYRLEYQTARLRSLDVPQELKGPLVVNDQNIIAAKEAIPPPVELILRYGGGVHSRKPHVPQCGAR